MTACIAPELVPDGRRGTTYGSVFIASKYDPSTDLDLLRHESQHAYQWAAGGAIFATSYLLAEREAQIWADLHAQRYGIGQIDSACFNRYEIDAGIKDGRYGPCPNLEGT